MLEQTRLSQPGPLPSSALELSNYCSCRSLLILSRLPLPWGSRLDNRKPAHSNRPTKVSCSPVDSRRLPVSAFTSPFSLLPQLQAVSPLAPRPKSVALESTCGRYSYLPLLASLLFLSTPLSSLSCSLFISFSFACNFFHVGLPTPCMVLSCLEPRTRAGTKAESSATASSWPSSVNTALA